MGFFYEKRLSSVCHPEWNVIQSGDLKKSPEFFEKDKVFGGGFGKAFCYPRHSVCRAKGGANRQKVID
jgi:hypothetical protein